jgi:hypothetical protein
LCPEEQISGTSPERKHLGHTPQPHKAILWLQDTTVEAEVEEVVAVAVVEVAFFLFLLGFFSFRALYVPSCMRPAEQISATWPERKHLGHTPQPHKASLCLHPMLIGLLVCRSNVSHQPGGCIYWCGWMLWVSVVFVFCCFCFWLLSPSLLFIFVLRVLSGSSQKSQRLVIVLRLNPFTILQMKYFGSHLIFTVQF